MATLVQGLIDSYKFLKDKGFMLGSSRTNPLLTAPAHEIQKELLFKQLKNSLGSELMSVDGSVTPVEFFVQPPADEVWFISRWMLYLEDAKGFDVTTWGSNGTLTNGLDLFVEIDGIETNQIEFPIKHNGDIAAIAYDMQLHTFGTGNDILTARWSFSKMGQFLRLDGSTSDRLVVRVNDNLVGVDKQTVNIQGFKG